MEAGTEHARTAHAGATEALAAVASAEVGGHLAELVRRQLAVLVGVECAEDRLLQRRGFSRVDRAVGVGVDQVEHDLRAQRCRARILLRCGIAGSSVGRD